MTFRHAGKHHAAALAAAMMFGACVPGVGAGELATSVTVETCTTCHGPAGVSEGAMPTIAGRDAAELAEALRGFRDGTLESTIMGKLVGPLSDEDITAISDYFATLPGADQ